MKISDPFLHRVETPSGDTHCVEVTPQPIPDTAAHRKSRTIRHERLFIVLALLLVMSVFTGTVVRVFVAASDVTYRDITDFTGISGVITDRFDQPIYEDGTVTRYDLFGNLIGYEDHIHNSLLYRHGDLLATDQVNAFQGYRALETQPRIMKTTLLSAESHAELAALYEDRSGCCFAYNYETGEVYTALSLPIYDPALEEPSYINRCFDSVYIPGSTMKVVTAVLAVDQGIDPDDVFFTCEGYLELSEEDVIQCNAVHGTIGFSDAIGQSCNCFYAQLIACLDLDKALETLGNLGFSVNGSDVENTMVDGLIAENSSTNITNTASFKNIWGLIGQGHSEVNAVTMARIAAAVVNGGKAATPYLLSSVINPNRNDRVIHKATTETDTLMSAQTADTTAALWKEGVDNVYYSIRGLSERIDYAKTGTAEQGDDIEYKLLVGVVESAKTAFYIVVEDADDITLHITIANKLAALLPHHSPTTE